MHYEISNFCQSGYMAKHNSNYWRGANYLGLGPSAHSYNGGKRQWNLSNNSRYINCIGSNGLFWREEELSELDRFNEYIMTSLRTIWGVDLDQLEKTFGPQVLESFLNGCKRHIDGGHLKKKGTKVIVTDIGKFITDSITADLFQVSDHAG